jgi:hypothetical protein
MKKKEKKEKREVAKGFFPRARARHALLKNFGFLG